MFLSCWHCFRTTKVTQQTYFLPLFPACSISLCVFMHVSVNFFRTFSKLLYSFLFNQKHSMLWNVLDAALPWHCHWCRERVKWVRPLEQAKTCEGNLTENNQLFSNLSVLGAECELATLLVSHSALRLHVYDLSTIIHSMGYTTPPYTHKHTHNCALRKESGLLL